MTTTASYLHHSLSGRSPPPEDLAHPSISGSNGGQEAPRRRGSFSFLRRTKSGTQLSASRIASGGKLTKRHRMTAREQEMMREQIPSHAPKIPDIPRPAQLQTFGGGDVRAGSVNHHSPMTNPLPLSSTHNGTAMYRNVPIPPIPQETKRGYVDPYARSESMTNRGRYSYASSAISTINSPRRLRRRKDPTPFKQVPNPIISIGMLLTFQPAS